MKISDVTIAQKLVILPGGYHPFHRGHFGLYQEAKKEFPSSQVILAATDSRKQRPFSFEDKKVLAQIAGVPAHSFIQVKKPFVADEYEYLVANPATTALIFVRSTKDRDQHPLPGDITQTVTRGPRAGQPPYLLSYEQFYHQLEPMTQHGYLAYLPTQEFGSQNWTSATEIRDAWSLANDEQKLNIVMDLYPSASSNEWQQAVEIIDRNLKS